MTDHVSPPRSRAAVPGQLPLPLPVRSAQGREDFFVTPANEAAVALVDGWPGWAAPWLALHGAPGAGKSHLAAIWAARAQARIVSLPCVTVASVPELAAGPALVVEAGRAGAPDEEALFHLINLVREEGRFLLLTLPVHPDQWPAANPHLRSRLRAMPTVELATPDDALLSAVLVKLFRDRQVTVSPPVIAYLAARMERSLGAAVGLVAEIDRLALARQSAVTRSLAAEALAAQS